MLTTWLRVVGNAIVDDDCTPQVLRGVSVIDPFFMKEVYKDGPKEERFRILAQRWKAKIIRVPIHLELWPNSRKSLLASDNQSF